MYDPAERNKRPARTQPAEDERLARLEKTARLKRLRSAYSDEAGHRFRFEAGQSFRFHSGRCSDLKPAIFRTDPGSR
ncbi:hypothetical protein MCHK_10255 [Mesorhizobium huakuii 7653R]|nr:hypothetical protein MCHK_10255 [Mesorhizobium huakuii 7653R]